MKRLIAAIVGLGLVVVLALPSVALAFVDNDGDGLCDNGGGDGIPDLVLIGDAHMWRGAK